MTETSLTVVLVKHLEITWKLVRTGSYRYCNVIVIERGDSAGHGGGGGGQAKLKEGVPRLVRFIALRSISIIHIPCTDTDKRATQCTESACRVCVHKILA